MAPIIEDKNTLLFQGDSITDCCRSRENLNHMGDGYALMASARFSALYPKKDVRFINRGIGGNQVTDMEGRWKEDCLDLKPNWLSIMIGINDSFDAFGGKNKDRIEVFEKSYRTILKAACDQLRVKLILIEPFLLPIPPEYDAIREYVDQRINVVHIMAKEFDGIVVPMQKIFNEAIEQREPKFWSEDGVHPTYAGHAIIAQEWLKAVKAV
jgi:acyl-CoA thioesterase-1